LVLGWVAVVPRGSLWEAGKPWAPGFGLGRCFQWARARRLAFQVERLASHPQAQEGAKRRLATPGPVKD